ncbi:MAG: V-type ATP synthase subunit A, partial [Clostridia bacterium]
DRIARGIEISAIDHEKKWNFVASAKVGDKVKAGDVIGSVQENEIISHKIMIPFGVSGIVEKITSGEFNVLETVAILATENGKKDVC